MRIERSDAYAADSIDRHTDYKRIEKSLDSLEEQVREKLWRTLVVTRNRLIQTVKRQFGQDKARSFLLTRKLRLRFGDTQEVLGDFLREGFGLGQRTLRDEVKSHEDFALPVVTPIEALRWLQKKKLWITAALSIKLTEKAKLILLNALKYGEPIGDTVLKLEDLFAPYVGNKQVLRNGKPISPAHLETLVRTNATEAFNMGRLAAARDPDLEGFIDYMKYSAVLDKRTTPICRYLDKRLFRMDDPELARFTPPNHFNCRSILVAVPVGVVIQDTEIVDKSNIGKAKKLTPKEFK